MKNKNNIIFIVVAIIIILVLCIVSPMLNSKQKSNTTDNSDEAILTRATEEANSLKKDEMKDFEKIDVDRYINLYNDDNTSVVLVGRDGCKYCTIAEPIIKNIMFMYNINIYYVSTDDFTKESYEKFSSSNEKLQSFSTPLLMIVSNGKINSYVEGLKDTDGYIEFFVNNEVIKEMEE